MIAFWFLFAFRSLAGVQNGQGYGKNNGFRVATAIVLTMLYVPVTVLLVQKNINTIWFFNHNIRMYLGLIAILLGILGVWGVDNSFSKRYKWLPQDIHFWEEFKTGGITFAFFLGGWDFWLIISHVYPALILHKGFVNLGGGHRFFYYGTNDATGKTFNIPFLTNLLNKLFPNRKWLKEVKISREPLKVRLAFSAISIIYVIFRLTIQ